MTIKAGERLQIIVNGEATLTGVETLAALLDALGYSGARVATALNGDFVSERLRASVRIKSGDKIEIVSARQGG